VFIGRTKWCLAAKKDAVGKRQNRARDMVRNPNGYRAVPRAVA